MLLLMHLMQEIIYFQILSFGSIMFVNCQKKTDYDWYVKTHPDFGSDWSFLYKS